jgi:hypothetical protein
MLWKGLKEGRYLLRYVGVSVAFQNRTIAYKRYRVKTIFAFSIVLNRTP